MDFLINKGLKKNSLVESFFRKNFTNLNQSLRHYESCVIESKGSLILSYVILTGDSLYVTQNPPSSFIHIIPLSWIQDISLIADRESLVRGGPRHESFICQHARIVYYDIYGSGKNNKKDLEDFTSSRASSALEGCLENEGSLSQLPLAIQKLFDPNYTNSSIPSQRTESEFSSDETLKDVTNKLFDSESESADLNSIVTGKSHDKLPRKKKLFSSTVSSSNSPFLLQSPAAPQQKLRFWKRRKPSISQQQQQQQHDSVKRPSSTDVSEISKIRRILFHKKTFNKKMAIIKPEDDPETENYTTTTDFKTKKKKNQQNSEVNLYFYKPESIFLNELFLLWNRQILSQLPETTDLDMEQQHYKIFLQEKQSKFTYFPGNSSNSIFIAEAIFQRLLTDEVYGLKILFSNNKSIGMKRGSQLLPLLYLLHKVIEKYEYLAYLCLKNSALLTNLQLLLKSSMIIEVGRSHDHNHAIEEVFGHGISWRNVRERANSGKKERSLKSDTNNRIKVLEIATAQKENKNFLMTKVSTHVLVMEVFRLLLQQSTTTKNNNNNHSLNQSTMISDENLISSKHKKLNKTNLNNNYISQNGRVIFYGENNQIIEIILNSIFLFPCLIEYNFNKKCLQLIQNDTFDADMNLIKLLCINHNASTALLYDILTVSQFSPKEKAMTNIKPLLEKYNMESYLKQSISQLLNLLWSSTTLNETFTIAQCTLLHRQLIVISYLIQNYKPAKEFMRQTFCEEFRYFINGECTNSKIPSHYSIKGKLLVVCDTLRNTIIS